MVPTAGPRVAAEARIKALRLREEIATRSSGRANAGTGKTAVPGRRVSAPSHTMRLTPKRNLRREPEEASTKEADAANRAAAEIARVMPGTPEYATSAGRRERSMATGVIAAGRPSPRLASQIKAAEVPAAAGVTAERSWRPPGAPRKEERQNTPYWTEALTWATRR